MQIALVDYVRRFRSSVFCAFRWLNLRSIQSCTAPGSASSSKKTCVWPESLSIIVLRSGMLDVRHKPADQHDIKLAVPHEGTRPPIAANCTRSASRPSTGLSSASTSSKALKAVSTRPGTWSIHQSRVDKLATVIASLELTRPEMLRTTPAHAVLAGFCRVLRDGPLSACCRVQWFPSCCDGHVEPGSRAAVGVELYSPK
eukprot:s4116_g10.t1